MAVTSDIDICNLALSQLKLRPITSFEDLNESARMCDLWYDVTREALLREISWNFATKTTTLALLADETVPAYQYLYIKPVGCLFVSKVFPPGLLADPNLSPYVEAPWYYSKNPAFDQFELMVSPDTNTPCIGSNVSDAYITFTRDVEDVAQFDSLFVLAFAAGLSAALAKPLTGDSDVEKMRITVYRSLIDQARQVNRNESKKIPEKHNSFLDAR